MHDLKDLTHDFHYENYRTEYIKAQKNNSTNLNKSKNNNNNIYSDEADRLLQQKDIELKKMQDLLAKMKSNMNYNSSNVNHNNNNNNNPVLSSFANKNTNLNIKQNLNTTGNHLISRHITNNSYTNNTYNQTDKSTTYMQNLNTFQSLTNSTPI
jgi:septin family protein